MKCFQLGANKITATRHDTKKLSWQPIDQSILIQIWYWILLILDNEKKNKIKILVIIYFNDNK